MSVTVNYKGNEIATVSNETKTLTTSGKWMEGDIAITDSTPELLIYDEDASNGSQIRNIYTVDTVSLQTSKVISSINSPQTIGVDSDYDYFSDGLLLSVNASFVTLATIETYIGDYTNDTINIDSGRIDKYYRKIYGK